MWVFGILGPLMWLFVMWLGWSIRGNGKHLKVKPRPKPKFVVPKPNGHTTGRFHHAGSSHNRYYPGPYIRKPDYNVRRR